MRRSLLAPALILHLLVVPATLPAQESEESDLRLDDVTLHYERTGDGPPLVLVHGWSMDMRLWDFQLPELADDFTVIRCDRRG